MNSLTLVLTKDLVDELQTRFEDTLVLLRKKDVLGKRGNVVTFRSGSTIMMLGMCESMKQSLLLEDQENTYDLNTEDL